MLLGSLKTITISGTLLLGLIAVVYFSKPDRGGIKRCQEIFGFNPFEKLEIKECHLSTWNPFENPKFKLKIKGDIDDVKNYFALYGFKEWSVGGVQYGSINIGWDETTNVVYSLKKFSGHVHIVVYDQTNSYLYIIRSQ